MADEFEEDHPGGGRGPAPSWLPSAGALFLVCLPVLSLLLTPVGRPHLAELPPRFHAPQCLNRTLSFPAYEALHRANRTNPAANLLVLTQVGGWGNLNLDLAHAFGMALAYDRVFVLLLAGESGEFMEPGGIDWRPGFVLPELSEDTGKYPSPLEFEALNHSDPLWSVNVVDGYRKPAMKLWDAALRARMAERGLDVSKVDEACISEYLLRPGQPVLDRMAAVLQQLSPGGAEYAAVHIRTGAGEVAAGDFGAGAKWNWFADPAFALSVLPGYIRRAMKDAKLPEMAKLFVAADDPEVGLGMLAAFPDRAVLTNTKLTLMGGLHTFRGTPSKEGALLVFVDWYLMMGSAVLVQATRSSYAASVSQHQGRHCTDLGPITNTLNGTTRSASCKRPQIKGSKRRSPALDDLSE
ncbi:hypothetical protein DFJ74DRAFT_682511 [Hyaloraphidium curvatum]|nr:hypothetical protein DFJ74DRAFT_682511 [Hyaloraphidium curvatum]